MLRSVYGSEHCIELIQTVMGGAAIDQLFRSNAALLSGPSWAAPHVVKKKKASAHSSRRRNHQLLAPDPRRGGT